MRTCRCPSINSEPIDRQACLSMLNEAMRHDGCLLYGARPKFSNECCSRMYNMTLWRKTRGLRQDRSGSPVSPAYIVSLVNRNYLERGDSVCLIRLTLPSVQKSKPIWSRLLHLYRYFTPLSFPFCRRGVTPNRLLIVSFAKYKYC